MDTNAEQQLDEERKTRVFLSYSRKDKDFTRKLAQALSQRGYVVDFDQSEHDPTNVETGISAEDDWWKRLQEMIAAAEAMVLIVSPHSAASQVCGEEIAYARALGKRVVPVLLREIDFNKAPPRLAALNVRLSFVEETEFDVSVSALAAVLNVDVSWHREGARLAALAVKWNGAGQPEAQLLSAGAVDEAESWAARRPANSPPPGEPVNSYIAAGRAKAVADRERLLTITGRAFVRPAEQALTEGRYDAALRLAAAGTVLGEDLDMKLVPERAPTALLAADTPLRAILCGHHARVWNLSYSGDGTRLITASADSTARVWDSATGRELLVLSGHVGEVACAVFSPDGERVVTASLDKTARVWDAISGRELATLRGHEEGVTIAVFSPDGKRVATAANDYVARIWDAESGRELVALRGHDSASSSRDHYEVRKFEIIARRDLTSHFIHAEFSSDGKRFLTVCDDATVRVWTADSGRQCALLQDDKGDFLLCGKFSPDGKRCVTGSTGGIAQVWDTENSKEVFAIQHEAQARIWRATFSPDGTKILTLSDNKGRTWDANSGHELTTLVGHEGQVLSASFSTDSTRILTASADSTVRVWDAVTGSEIAVLRGHEGRVWSASFSPDGTRIGSASDSIDDQSVRVWDAAADRVVALIPVSGSDGLTASFSPDGKRIATVAGALGDGTARLWDAATGCEINVLRGNQSSAVLSAAFSGDGSRILTAFNDNTMRLWDGASGKPVTTIRVASEAGPSGLIAALSPDGTRIAAAPDFAKSVNLWDAATGRVIVVLTGRDGTAASAIAFSHDGQRVATGWYDGTTHIWDAGSGREVSILAGQRQRVKTIAFSPDCERIITGSDCAWDISTHAWTAGGEARLWDARSGRELAVLLGHKYGIQGAQFSQNGSFMLTASSDSVRVWRADSGQLLWALDARDENLIDATFSPDGTRVAIASTNQTARILDAESGHAVLVLRGHEGSVLSVAFSPDSALLLCGSGQTARLWDVASSAGLVGPVAEALAAILANGRGVLTQRERTDLLLQSVGDEDRDLGTALMRRLAMLRPGVEVRVSERAGILSLRRHPNCYLVHGDRCASKPIANGQDLKGVRPKENPEPLRGPPAPMRHRARGSVALTIFVLTFGTAAVGAALFWLLTSATFQRP